MKKLLTLMLSLILVFSISMPICAASEPTQPAQTEQPAPLNFGDPISETSYYDEELGATVTECTYFVPDKSISTFDDKSGRGWYKNERTYYWTASDKETKTYAQGYFIWGDGAVSVSNETGGYDYFPSNSTITEEGLSSGTGKYGFVFNNFAYVTYTFKFTTQFGGKFDYSVTIRVSESGNAI